MLDRLLLEKLTVDELPGLTTDGETDMVDALADGVSGCVSPVTFYVISADELLKSKAFVVPFTLQVSVPDVDWRNELLMSDKSNRMFV